MSAGLPARSRRDARVPAAHRQRPAFHTPGPKLAAPDVLVLMGDGYVPVDVKLHGARDNAARG